MDLKDYMRDKAILSRKEVADILGLSVVTIDRAIKAKKISFYRFGTRVCFGPQHIEEFLRANEHTARQFNRRGSLGKENN